MGFDMSVLHILLADNLLLAVYDNDAFLGKSVEALTLHVVDTARGERFCAALYVLNRGKEVVNLDVGVLDDVEYRTVVVPCPVAHGGCCLVGYDTGEVG
jgi:hypothetical protein